MFVMFSIIHVFSPQKPLNWNLEGGAATSGVKRTLQRSSKCQLSSYRSFSVGLRTAGCPPERNDDCGGGQDVLELTDGIFII